MTKSRSLVWLTGDIEFLGVLGRILTWLLQQKPCRTTSCDLKAIPWYCVAANLSKAVSFLAEAEAGAVSAKVACYKQLDGVGGKD